MMIHFRFIFQILKQRYHNVTVQELVLSSLAKHGYSSPNDKCLLQCFELSTLEGIKGQTQKLGYHKNREKSQTKSIFIFLDFHYMLYDKKYFSITSFNVSTLYMVELISI